MVKITGNFGKVKSWINRLIRAKATGNLFVGEDSGKVTTGNYNTFMGYRAGYSNTGGHYNNFIGYQAGYNNIGGYYNDFMGYRAGLANTTGTKNTFMGYRAGSLNTSGADNIFIGSFAGYNNTTGQSNIFIGVQTGYSNISGQNNTCIGSKAGFSCATGWRGVHIGYEAGYYELNGDKLIVDNDKRADTAAEQANAMLYGLFAAAGAADQRLSINARLLVRTVPTYANDAAAGTGGLATGEVYKHADGSVHIKL